jgi:uncharacterized protein (DUF2384 family)
MNTPREPLRASTIVREIRIDHITRLLANLYDSDSECLAWFNSAQPLLQHQTPSALIETDDGYNSVCALLHGILDGAYL